MLPLQTSVKKRKKNNPICDLMVLKAVLNSAGTVLTVLASIKITWPNLFVFCYNYLYLIPNFTKISSDRGAGGSSLTDVTLLFP